MDSTPPPSELRLIDVLAAARRRLVTVVLCLGSGLVVAGGVTLLLPPSFRAEARVSIEDVSRSSGLLASLGNLPAGIGGLVPGSAPTAAEIERLRSRRLLRSVAGPRGTSEIAPESGLDLGLVVVDHGRYSLLATVLRKLRGTPAPGGSLAVQVTRWDFPASSSDGLVLTFLGERRVRLALDRFFDARPMELAFEPGVPFEFGQATLVLRPEGDLTGRRFTVGVRNLREAVDELLDRLTIKETTRGSSVLSIGYACGDPELAAEVVNALVRSYLAHNRERFVERIDRSLAYLQSELERVRAELAAAEEALARRAAEVGPAAMPAQAEAWIARMSEVELERARLDFRGERLRGLLDALQKGELDDATLGALETAGPLSAAALSGGDLAPLAELLARRETLRLTYTEEWPELLATRLEIDRRRLSIAAALEFELEQVERNAQGLEAIRARYEGELLTLPDTQVELVRGQRSVRALSEIQLFLVGQLEDAKISRASAAPSVEVVDWAIAPLRRTRPSIRDNLAVGAVLGLFVGLALAFLRELGRPLVGARRLAELAAVEPLGVVARRRGLGVRSLLDSPRSAAIEDFRTLRAALGPALRRGEVHALLVTSSGRGEGRSLVATGIACALARGGERVLLVDADTRGRGASRALGLGAGAGLSEALDEGRLPEGTASGLSNLELLGPGSAPAGLADRVAAGALAPLLVAARERYDRVVLDGPAVLGSSEAVTLSAALDATLFVARAERLGEDRIEEALARLRRAGARPLGVVLNGARRSE